MRVPFLDLKAQHRALRREILESWMEILDSTAFVGGTIVEAFEAEFARACGVNDAIAVSSGTDALRLIFVALGVKPGDEIITAPNSFIATTEAISQAGGKIVFVDIRPDTYNLDAGLIEAAITPRTVGIVPVHLYGQMAEMDRILAVARRRGIWVVEDAAQAHLAQYKKWKAGSLGAAAGFSFYPGKNLGACGEAGAVTTNDVGLASKIRGLRDHGQTRKYYHDQEGYNNRCDALQAATLRIKLQRLHEWNEARRRHASLYYKRLEGINVLTLPFVHPDCVPVFHLFVIQVDDRDDVAARLKECGIATGLHYPIPLHRQAAYAGMGIPEGTFPVSETYAKRLLSLPMFPEMTEMQIGTVCKALQEILALR